MEARLQEGPNVIICAEFLKIQAICDIKGRGCRKLAPNMLLNSASEEKSEGEAHLALLECKGNNVYKFGDLLLIVALVKSINYYHHRSNRQCH